MTNDPLSIVRAYYDLFEHPDEAVLDASVADDFRLDDDPIDWHLRGKSALWETVNRSRPPSEPSEAQGSFVVHEYFGDADAGVARWEWNVVGKTATMFGLPASPNMALVYGLALVSFRNGQLASLREFWDAAALLRQFGVDVPRATMQTSAPSETSAATSD